MLYYRDFSYLNHEKKFVCIKEIVKMEILKGLKKFAALVNEKYVFYRRIAIVLFSIENYIDDRELISNKLKITIKRITAIDENIEKKLQEALLNVDFHPLPFDVKEAKERLNRNYRFVVLEHNEEFIGWTWDAVGSIYIPELEEIVKLKEKEAFSFNTYIEKSYRNKGLNKIMLHGKIRFLRNEKFKKEWGHIWSWNIPSLKSFTGMGWEIVGYYHYFKFFFIKIRFRAYKRKDCSI